MNDTAGAHGDPGWRDREVGRMIVSTEQLCHTIRKRTLRSGWRERKKWKDGFKYYSISSEELDELEKRASA